MTTISGFTFIHNAIESGYPIAEAIRAVQPYVDEIVVVDMQSTDDTLWVLMKLADSCVKGGQRGRYCDCAPIRIIDGLWGTNSGAMLDIAYSKYIECAGDIIIQFEADEVFDDNLLIHSMELISQGITNLAVYRIQLEQNFQRCKWYPEPVHRIFPKRNYTKKAGHTTNLHDQAHVITPEYGHLWDISNCFRDQWLGRIEKMAEYRREENNYLMVPAHCNLNVRPNRNETNLRLGERHWTWTTTPFAIPKILKPLVGQTKYRGDI